MWWNKGCWWRAECASRDGFLIGSWGTGALCRFCWWPIQKSGQDWWQQGLWCGGVWWCQQWRNLPDVWISRKSQVCDFAWFPKHSCSVYPLWKCPKALMHCFSWSNPSIFNKCREHKILRCLSISVPCLCIDMHSCNTFRLRSITLSNNTMMMLGSSAITLIPNYSMIHLVSSYGCTDGIWADFEALQRRQMQAE